jgi:hypothetical protein
VTRRRERTVQVTRPRDPHGPRAPAIEADARRPTMSPNAMARVSDAGCSDVRLRRSRQAPRWPSIVLTTPPEVANDVTQGAAARNVASEAPAGTARKRGSAAVARRGGSADKASPARARTAFWVEYRFGAPANRNAPPGSCWESR